MSPPRPRRIEQALATAFAGTVMVLSLLAMPFVLRWSWHGAAFDGWSNAHLRTVVLPYLSLLAAWILIVLPPTGRWLRTWLGRWPRWLGITLGAASLAGLLYSAHHASAPFASVLLYALYPSVFALLWWRGSGRVEPLLACLPLPLVGIALFGFELVTGPPAPRLLSDPVVWGDDDMFRTLFPKQPPLIGPGGRLLANLDILTTSVEHPDGVGLVTNAEGFRNRDDLPRNPDAGELRVLNLGDSFSIGMQIDQDEFLGPLLAKRLRERSSSTVTVLNAEVSDPAYGLVYLQDHGDRYRPDIVVFGLSGNDLIQTDQFVGADRLLRLTPAGELELNPGHQPGTGPFERYADFAYPTVAEHALATSEAGAPPGLLEKWGKKLRNSLRKVGREFGGFRLLAPLRPGPDSATAAAVILRGFTSHLERADGRKRLIDGNASLGFFYRHGTTVTEPMFAKFFDVLASIDRVVRDAGARFVLFVHPQRCQVAREDWQVMRDYWRLDERDFDLRLYNRRIREFCRQRGILCCDPVEEFAQAAAERELYLARGDMHYNRAGHALAAAVLARFLVDAELVPARAK